MDKLTIGEVARRVGLRTSALRYYESVGLLPAPHRVNGRHRYDESVLRTLAVIQIAQQAGFTVAEIRTLLHEFPANTAPSVRWQSLATKKLDEVNALIERAMMVKMLLEQALRCGCVDLEACAALLGYKNGGKADVQLACGIQDYQQKSA
jgi:MerR family transcriptional regulator, redox-sensitive transcriptional activator SoxR